MTSDARKRQAGESRVGREWKPGDVAMVECSDGEWRMAHCEPHANYSDVLAWRFPDRVYRYVHNSSARPVVTIDPDDRAQVEELQAAWASLSTGFAELMDEPWSMGAMRMRQALRKFANPTPPKPDEPTGTFARIEDERGLAWCRMPEGGWKCETGAFVAFYELLPGVVRVLSDGVQP